MSGTFGVVGGTLLGGAAATPLTRVDGVAGVTVTADTAAHTKGAWTELIASTSGAATMVVLDVSGINASGVATATLIDLAIGAGGSEVAFLSNLPLGSAAAAGSGLSCFQIPLPVAVPSGSRVSARIQSVVTGGKTASIGIGLFSGGAITPGALTVLGANTATSRGVALGTTHMEIIASTAATYRHLVIVPSASTVSNSTGRGDVTLGYGGAGIETDIGSILVQTNPFEQLGCPVGHTSWAVYNVWPGVPSGTRLALMRGAGLPPTVDGAIIGVS